MIPHEGAEPGTLTPAIVGLGSPHGDDQLGWIAIDRLRPRLPAGVSAVKVASGVELLGFLVGQGGIIIVDAAAPARHPGAIRWFVWPCADLAARLPWSTHGLGLVEALQLAEALDQLPRQVTIATVEAHTTAPGLPLSSPASRGLDELVESIIWHFSSHSAVGVAAPGQGSSRWDRDRCM